MKGDQQDATNESEVRNDVCLDKGVGVDEKKWAILDTCKK